MFKKCSHDKCLLPAVSRDLCVTHMARKRVPLEEYSKRARLPRRPEAPHGLTCAELEYCVDDETAKQAARAVSTSYYDGSVDAEYKIVGSCESLPVRAAGIAFRASQVGARVDRRCGFHVHIDVTAVNDNSLGCLFDWLNKQETRSAFRAILPSSRHDNEYCQWSGRLSQRYNWANYRPQFKTIELRCHPGSLHPSKVYGWLCVANQLGDLWRSNDTSYLNKSPQQLLSGDAATYWQMRLASPSLSLPSPNGAR